MKRLRETIRKLILENNDHYEKIAVMLCAGDIASVKQALELAEVLDYAHNVEYKKINVGGYDGVIHRWTFSVVRPLHTFVMAKISQMPHSPDFSVFPIRNHSIGIKIVE